MTRKPSPQQLDVLRALVEGRDPFAGLAVNARIGRERTVYACQRYGWIEWSHVPPRITDAGRAIVEAYR